MPSHTLIKTFPIPCRLHLWMKNETCGFTVVGWITRSAITELQAIFLLIYLVNFEFLVNFMPDQVFLDFFLSDQVFFDFFKLNRVVIDFLFFQMKLQENFSSIFGTFRNLDSPKPRKSSNFPSKTHGLLVIRISTLPRTL